MKDTKDVTTTSTTTTANAKDETTKGTTMKRSASAKDEATKGTTMKRSAMKNMKAVTTKDTKDTTTTAEEAVTIKDAKDVTTTEDTMVEGTDMVKLALRLLNAQDFFTNPFAGLICMLCECPVKTNNGSIASGIIATYTTLRRSDQMLTEQKIAISLTQYEIIGTGSTIVI